MKFDDTERYINEKSLLFSKHINPVLDKYDVKEILGKLQEEYAPEVVMTTEELEIFNSYRLNNDLPAPFTTLLANINEYNVNEWSDEAFGTQSEEDLMTAWLHPEVITVKGDK